MSDSLLPSVNSPVQPGTAPPAAPPPPAPRAEPALPPAPSGPPRRGFWGALEDQLALRPLLGDYLTPVEVNNIWYALGGVLAIALGLEFLTGFLLLFRYTPDAGQAYAQTVTTLHTPGWSTILNFHYYNAYLIFALVMIHMLRVFISGGYRRGKQALWQVGVALAGFTFLLSTTGESLHWDEVGFAVPWHISEMLDAFGWAQFWNYTHAQLKDISIATEKLGQIYGTHISLAAILLVVFIIVHYYLIKQKGISLPFWLRQSGRTAPFTAHVREWFVIGGVILGVVLLIAIFLPRDDGIAPQLLSPAQVKASFAAQGNAQYVAGKSEQVLTDTVDIPGGRSDPASPTVALTNLDKYLAPLYKAGHGPGGLGYKPTFPISWTHGMNIFYAKTIELFTGEEPEVDIWGTMIGMGLLLLTLILIPFVDTGAHEPANRQQAFDFRKRGLAFALMAVFWLVLIVGTISNMLAGPG